MILGFDTATFDTAVAVAGADPVERLRGPEDGRPLHARVLLGLIEEVVGEVGGWDAVELIAVGTGPGSFTGLRIGVSTARALAQSRRLAVVGVPTTSALLAGIAELPESDGRARLAAVDARRGELFVAVDGGEGASEALVTAPDQIGAVLGSQRIEGAIAAGDGALRFRGELEAAGATVPPEESLAHRVSARHVCELGAASDPVDPELIRPHYLRRPDAERWQQRDGRN